MSELERIVDQLQRAYRGEAWHGPSIREVLDGVDVDAASARPVSNAHTIRELVVHVVVWEQEALARLAGKSRDDLPPEEDWPAGAPAWADLLDELDAAHERLTSAISELDAEPGDEALDETVAGSPGTVYHLLHGVIQHNLLPRRTDGHSQKSAYNRSGGPMAPADNVGFSLQVRSGAGWQVVLNMDTSGSARRLQNGTT